MRLAKTLAAFATATLFSLSIAACGGGDDGGDDDDTQPDASITVIDAPPQAPDAAASSLGQICNQQMSCPTDVPICATPQGASNGFCTMECGTTPASDNPMPPPGGDAICQEGYVGSATPACTVYFQQQGTTDLLWGCGLLCGTVQNMDLGTCPAGLTCQNNLCIP